MKEKSKKLKFYNFSHPLLDTEILSLLGDKYISALPFSLELSQNYDECDVVLWDGLISPRRNSFLERVLRDVREKKLLLLLANSDSLFRDHPIVSIVEYQDRVVKVGGMGLLPEDILDAFEKCFQKLNHV